MGRHLSVETAIEKNRIASATPFLLLLDIHVTDPNTRTVVETLRYVKNSEVVIFNGQSYQPGNFELDINSRQNEQPSVSLNVLDTTGFIRSRLEAYVGGTFSEVTVYVVNTDRLDKKAEVEEKFQVLGSSVKEFMVSFKIGVENALGIRFPTHKQFRNQCAWRFRDPVKCKYAGPIQTCDYTYDGANGCLAKANTINFGGERGIIPLNI